MDWPIFIVRLLHIFFGVTWVGGSIFYGHSVVGGLMRVTPQVRAQAMLGIVGKMMTLFLVAGPLTIVFGVWHQMQLGIDFESRPLGTLLGVSLGLALATLVVALSVSRPAFNRLKAIAAGPQPPPADVAAEAVRMGKRMMFAGIAMTVLVVAALGLMVAVTTLRSGYV